METWQFRMLKAATPGPYTFLLPATKETPRRLQHEKRRTIGIRVPDHEVPRLLLAELGEPIMSSTLLLPGDELPLTDGREIRNRLEHQVDCVLDGGHCGIEPTTVVDLAVSPPAVTRIGRGSLETLGFERCRARSRVERARQPRQRPLNSDFRARHHFRPLILRALP